MKTTFAAIRVGHWFSQNGINYRKTSGNVLDGVNATSSERREVSFRNEASIISIHDPRPIEVRVTECWRTSWDGGLDQHFVVRNLSGIVEGPFSRDTAIVIAKTAKLRHTNEPTLELGHVFSTMGKKVVFDADGRNLVYNHHGFLVDKG